MKCRSVACIWPDIPPLQKVTATASLNYPPTLYTGGSDGSILQWNISLSDSDSEIKPVAMLCGHAASIADLSICYPIAVSADDKESSSVTSASNIRGALFSVCADGVMCVWSRGSGHCRRRRKMPPWVGTPSIVCTLPMSSRYVCIGCCINDGSTKLSDHQFVESLEGNEVSIDRESQNRKPAKCAVVIVDTYSLTIVQTVFHGNLSIGSLNFMDLVLSGEDGEKHSVLLADLCGRVLLVPILKDSNLDVEDGGDTYKSSQFEIWGNGLSEGQVVAVATCGDLVALLLKKCCIFRLLSTDTTIGEISLLGNLISEEGNSSQSFVVGGLFLESGNTIRMQNSEEAYERFWERFVVWNNAGSAVVYTLSYLKDVFKCEQLCEIPAASHPPNVRLSVSFLQSNSYLLRIESICFDPEEPLLWEPHLTICSLHENNGILSQCNMFRASELFSEWISSSALLHGFKGNGGRTGRVSLSQSSVSCSEIENGKYGFASKGRNVTSSMVISENHFVPYAVVYGYFGGEIEVVRFDIILGLDSYRRSPRHDENSHVSKQYFTGHTGAVLCLAAHQMLGTAKGWSFRHVLVSGSTDWTIRIWDLDTGNLITVMHQHVAPVRQIIFPPARTECPWSDCFLSVGEDFGVSLVSLETLRVERMFPGHPSYPEKVVWDGTRGYVACLCQSRSGTSDVIDVLYIWDVKTGARERVLRGTASHSMLDHFCKGVSANSKSGSILNGNTSVSSLLLPIIDDASYSQSQADQITSSNTLSSVSNLFEPSTSHDQGKMGNSVANTTALLQCKFPIRCTCPFPGIATLNLDLESLMFSCQENDSIESANNKQENANVKDKGSKDRSPPLTPTDQGSHEDGISTYALNEKDDLNRSLEELLLRFSLSILHLWNVDCKLDRLLVTDLKLTKPENFILASGLQGDKGSLTLAFPDLTANLELWKSSSEFCAMRSLTMVSIAQRMISLSPSSSAASRALAAFYTRNIAIQIPDIKPPLLQLLASFWQDESEHVRMAARTLFHCAASREIPSPLCSHRASDHGKLMRSLSEVGGEEEDASNIGEPSAAVSSNLSPDLHEISANEESCDESSERQQITEAEESKILAWLESFEAPDWISCVGGTSQDAMTSHIIVAAALAIWYPSLVKPSLAMLVVHPLIKLVMAMNGKYSSSAAELLAEGMEDTWKACISSEIPRLIADIFFQIECVSSPSAVSAGSHPAVPPSIRETLVGTLLPSLAMADILGFLTVIERQIWSTASDSPVHLVSLATLIRVVRTSPKYLAQYLDKVVSFILHTMDPGNSVMRKTCLQSSMTALKEVIRVFPMVAMNNTSTRLAVGNAIGEVNNASISVYDMQSGTKVKVLDASGPPGLPTLLSGASETAVTTVISALSFSPDGEGLVAFSENGLTIRWWSLGSVWWEKLSRNLVPVLCTKLIFVPPWEGFSPNYSRSSVMASITGHDKHANLKENSKGSNYAESLKMVIHNLDLSYRLEWAGERKVALSRHGIELGTFPL